MNLRRKKQLAARTLGVGTGKIIFLRVDDVKEAITKQDIRDLVASGAILIREERGRRKTELGGRRGPGKVKKKINTRKQDYVRLTRKLREYSKQLFVQGKVTKEKHKELRKQIKSSNFRSKAHMKELLVAED